MKTLRILLIILSIFIAINAIGGGISLIYTDGLGMPLVWLNGSLFNNYIIPGFILFIVVGGTYVVSLFGQWRNLKSAPILSSIAGFGLLIWIFTELYIIGQPHFLQVTFFGLAILTLVLSILQLVKSRQVDN